MPMSTRNRVFFSGLMAVVLAAVIIGASSYVGYLPIATQTPTGGGGNNQGTGNNQTGGQGGTTQTAAQGTVGTLSILVTDPPQVPEGVTAVYITYDELAVHPVASDLRQGWIELNVSGTIESMGLINVSQTIAAAQVPAGSYDLVRFNVSSVAVTYNNLTYSAALSSNTFVAAFVGGLQVNNSQVSAALVDVEPTVLNAGSASNPQFVFRLSLNALALVRNNINLELTQIGFRMDLGNMSWYVGFRANATRSLTIDSAALANDSLSVTVTNSGNGTQNIEFIVVTPALYATGTGGMQPMYRLPDLYGSIVFAVEPNGSLQPVSMGTPQLGMASAIASRLGQGGFNLTAGGSATFSYHGALSISSDSTGLGTGIGGGNVTVAPPGGGSTSSAAYQIAVIGDTASASITVRALG